MSYATNRRLADIEGKILEPSSSRSKTVSAPTVVLLSDPLADIETVINAFASADEEAASGRVSRRPNSWLQKQRLKRQRVSQRSSGLLVYDGRQCCMIHLNGLNRIVSRLRLPYYTECPTCRATFAIEQRVRRAHG